MNPPVSTDPSVQSATQKSPVIDSLQRPLHDLRISVIDRCNFRCPYCMPPEEDGHKYNFFTGDQWLTFAEIVRLVKIFVRNGACKIRLTGGEPLLRPNLPDLIRELNTLPGIEDLALTTNGMLLEKYARELKNAGLSRLTVSLDTLDEAVFWKMSGGRGSLRQVLKGIASAEAAGFKNIKINTVVQKHVNDRGLLDLVKHFRNTGHIVRFIEYMDVGNCNHWVQTRVVPSLEILKMIQAEFPLQPVKSNYWGEVAKRYRLLDGSAEIGFISSISQPFCGSCTRARLSTDGKLFTCLFARKGTDLKKLLRSGAPDEELLAAIRNIWKERQDRYSEQRPSYYAQPRGLPPKVEMFQVGG